jgi:hypothetical protein
MLKNLKHHTRWGLITGLLITIYIGLAKGTALKAIPAAEFGIFLILIAGVAASAFLFAKLKNYEINFGNAFGNAFRTTAMTALLVVAANMLSYVMYPKLKQDKLDALRQQGVALNKPTIEIDKVVAEQDKNFYALELSRTIFPLMMIGVLSSLVMGVFTTAMARSTSGKKLF